MRQISWFLAAASVFSTNSSHVCLANATDKADGKVEYRDPIPEGSPVFLAPNRIAKIDNADTKASSELIAWCDTVSIKIMNYLQNHSGWDASVKYTTCAFLVHEDGSIYDPIILDAANKTAEQFVLASISKIKTIAPPPKFLANRRVEAIFRYPKLDLLIDYNSEKTKENFFAARRGKHIW